MINVEVRISDKRDPSRFMIIPMIEYRKMIEEQACNFGMIDQKETDKDVTGYEIQLTEAKIPDELLQMFIENKENKSMCPRCKNVEIEDVDNFCKICGLPMNREENEDE